ncbi:hypothetical protein BZG36_00984 [Bifiguratus adelaidae]|uniref:Uncharacterized protein n=1 Tax=Bifiguratus adelaidae TaxID=1938954 RepID=A0A261Y650_9FUNG|nr:hypothetical protein BZG36_00984 [Bifiguratus adelaidae]
MFSLILLAWIPLTTSAIFDHILVFVLQTTDFSAASSDSYLSSLGGVQLTNYEAVFGLASQPNYFAMTSGSTQGITDNGHYDVGGSDIVDLLDQAGLSWKAYFDDYPGACCDVDYSSNMQYVRYHNPFISYNDIRNNASRCDNIVIGSQLQQDVNSGNWPNYMFYVPAIDYKGM